MKPALASPLAGLTAALPMLAAMELIRRTRPSLDDHRHTPPRHVTHRVLDKLGLPHPPREHHRKLATLFAHVLFGAAAAAPYPALARRAPGPPTVKGMTYGLLVGLLNYEFVLPAADLQPPLHRRPPRRLAVILVPHLLWGALLPHLTGAFSHRAAAPQR